ncbi:hypothetical protein HT031_003801 [Scenedesmus sp. PABB004]|nr:hypothetical protein HT031_003801 [Scenedesmus sp. PABB004]
MASPIAELGVAAAAAAASGDGGAPGAVERALAALAAGLAAPPPQRCADVQEGLARSREQLAQLQGQQQQHAAGGAGAPARQAPCPAAAGVLAQLLQFAVGDADAAPPPARPAAEQRRWAAAAGEALALFEPGDAAAQLPGEGLQQALVLRPALLAPLLQQAAAAVLRQGAAGSTRAALSPGGALPWWPALSAALAASPALLDQAADTLLAWLEASGQQRLWQLLSLAARPAWQQLAAAAAAAAASERGGSGGEGGAAQQLAGAFALLCPEPWQQRLAQQLATEPSAEGLRALLALLPGVAGAGEEPGAEPGAQPGAADEGWPSPAEWGGHGAARGAAPPRGDALAGAAAQAAPLRQAAAHAAALVAWVQQPFDCARQRGLQQQLLAPLAGADSSSISSEDLQARCEALLAAWRLALGGGQPPEPSGGRPGALAAAAPSAWLAGVDLPLALLQQRDVLLGCGERALGLCLPAALHAAADPATACAALDGVDAMSAAAVQLANAALQLGAAAPGGPAAPRVEALCGDWLARAWAAGDGCGAGGEAPTLLGLAKRLLVAASAADRALRGPAALAAGGPA